MLRPFILSLLFAAATLAATTQPATQDKPVQPLVRKTFDIAALARDFPPILKDANKQIVYDLACPKDASYSGKITFTRWSAQPLPQNAPANTALKIESHADFFTYDAPPKGTIAWHLNFADHDLFASYGSRLLAQDELQVAEHPILASLRQALLHEKLSTLTTESAQPTPILITGAQRRVRITTAPNAAEGRPLGLYGNQFARASAEAIRSATTVINPPTPTNIIAIEAPSRGTGDYTADQIRSILLTAYSGFRAAKLEFASPDTNSPKVAIHTGFWGCGAYGGNRILMTILQLHAARLADIDELHYHTGDKAGLAQFQDAQKILNQLTRDPITTDALIDKLASRQFRWGTSDGN